jgi:hypothetical protein
VIIAILPKAINMNNAIPLKIPMTFCTEKEKNNHELHLETQKTFIRAKANLIKKANAGGITIPNFKLYYRAITMKTT